MTRLEQAKAEIRRLRDEALVPWLWAAAEPVVDGMLAAADATLDRHKECFGVCAECADSTSWPCPDADAVLDLYAPEPA